MSTTTPGPAINGSPSETSTRTCPGCGAAFSTGFGKWCGRRCAALNRTRRNVNDQMRPLVEAALPQIVSELLPAVVDTRLPDVVASSLTTNAVREVLQSIVEATLAVPKPDPKVLEPPPTKVPINRTEQQEAIERLQSALLRKLDGLPGDWKRVLATRETGGSIRVEVVF